MASASHNPVAPGPLVLRLTSQLQALSELTESLAFRLLELEERLGGQELRMQPLLESASRDALHLDDTELRLNDTEARLARLESLLGGSQEPGATRQGASVLALARAEQSIGPVDPFFEEGEQLFMDEQAIEAPGDSGLEAMDRLSA